MVRANAGDKPGETDGGSIRKAVFFFFTEGYLAKIRIPSFCYLAEKMNEVLLVLFDDTCNLVNCI